jgi:two-component system, OmpR family, sensor histidine kinase MtrB
MSSFLARFRPRRLGLRSRITLTFTLGAFALSLLLAGTTYGLTRSTLVRQRDSSILRQTYQNARIVQNELESDPTSVQGILTGLQLPSTSRPALNFRGAWTSLTAEYGEAALPDALKTRVMRDNTPARMISTVHGKPALTVGVPLTTVGASYFEIVSLDELQNTLNSVGVSLIGATVLTTSLGVMLGIWASRRAVRPLADAALAAKAIAGGRLDTRLESTDDKDLRELSTAFNDMAAALQLRVERDARFASDVSHELRSPLMTLSASIEVLQARRDDMPERAATALDLLVADVARFQNLVEDLLEISRFDAGAVRLVREDLLVAEFVRQAVSVSSVRDAPVKVSEKAESLLIKADKRRLARVIANLIDNARIHGAPATGADDDPTFGVEVEVSEPPGDPDPVAHVWISVSDHGPGVPREERPFVFERFSRGGGAGRRGSMEGAGLGLALVDEHVRLHGGRVWVEDRVDGEPGARFIIELPAEEL